MRHLPLPLAAVAAVTALVLPVAFPALPVAGVLLGACVVVGTGWDGHRAAARALRCGTVTADTGISLSTLAALAWSAPSSLVATISPAGVGALAPGTALLPGTAAVLTAVAVAVRRTGRPGDGAEPASGGPVPGRPPDGLRAAADRWSARLVPAAALLAPAVAGFRIGVGQPWTAAVPAGLAVLLVACPVALVAAVPAAVRAADRAGGPDVRLPLPVPARPAGDDGPADGGRGRPDAADPSPEPAWLDPVGWSAPHRGPRATDRVDTVALAGPEVLTGAVPAAVVAYPARGVDTAAVLRLAGSVAAGAGPGSDLAPVARALAAAAPDALPDVAEADERPGLGVSGLVAELVPPGRDPDAPGARDEPAGRAGATVVAHAVLLGSPCWLLRHGIGLPADVAAARERAEAEGRAVVAVAWDGTARAVLALTRAPGPGARPGVAALRAAGTAPVLLTPDDDGAARALGAAAGLDPSDPDAVRAGLDPGGRAAAVAGLRVRGRTVAVAADPATDAAALDRADLPVELHPRGPGPDATDPVPPPTGGSARIVVRGGPAEVATALGLARRARGHARTGIRVALAVTAIGTVAAVAGASAPLVAALPVLGAAAVRVRRIRPGR